MKLRPLVAGNRGIAAAAVVALALGIGVTSLMFAIVDGAVRRGLPVPRAGEVVHLERFAAPDEPRRPMFLLGERAMLQPAGALSGVAAYRLSQTNITGAGLTPRRWDAALVTPDTFPLLGVAVAHGTGLDRAAAPDAGATPVVISDDVWRLQFGADPSAVGRAVRANGVTAVIVGVMPPGFRFPFNQHLWMPLDDRAATQAVSFWGRLAPGVSVAEAGTRLTTTYQQAMAASGAPAVASAARIGASPYTAYILQPPVVQLLQMLFVAGLGVLIIACANVANLLLARGLARRRDFAIAGALGASRARIMRERAYEGLALAIPGALLGLLFAYAGAAAFTRAVASSWPPPPYWVSIVIDARVVAYAAAVAIVSAIAASALPAWRGGRAALSRDLSEEGRGYTSGSLGRATAVLVIVEIALATAVMIAAGLMTRGVTRLASADYAFALDDVLTGRVTLPARVYATPDERRAFAIALHARLQSLPGTRASLASSMPFAAVETVPFWLDRPGAQAGAPAEARRMVVSPGHFETLGVRLIGGRDFETADDVARAPVAIVNLSFALKFARREDLIGRRIRIGSDSAIPATIVGIAPDLAVGNPRGEAPEAVYVPLFQHASPPDGVTILARAPDDPAIERRLREVVASINPELPLDRVMTLAAFRTGVTWFYRVFGTLFLTFGAGALMLALVGVYAVMSFGVTRRRREIGTRMACGATRAHIARMFLREASWRLGIGLGAGLLIAAWLTPRLSLFLFQVSPRDPAVYAWSIAIVAAIGLAACALPAWRAASQDPNVALRE